MSGSFRIELGLEEAVELHLALGEDDGRLYALRRGLRDFLYEQLSIEELEGLAASKTRGGEGFRPHSGTKGFL